MKKLFILFSFINFLMYSATSFSFNYLYGWYVQGQGGLTVLGKTEDSKSQRLLELHSKPTYNFGGSLGYKFDQFRVAFTSHFAKTRIEEVNTRINNSPVKKFTNDKSTTGNLKDFILNSYYDFTLDGPVKFIFGVGAGYSHMKLNYYSHLSTEPVAQRFSRSYNVFVYNAIVGFHLILNHMWDLSLEYRYHSTFSQKIGQISNNNFFESSFDFHSLDIGIVLKIS